LFVEETGKIVDGSGSRIYTAGSLECAVYRETAFLTLYNFSKRERERERERKRERNNIGITCWFDLFEVYLTKISVARIIVYL
jgi:hypothetical protein